MRSNFKGLPKDLIEKHMQKGKVDARYKGKLMALQWRDKKYVHMLSTTHNASVTIIISRSKSKQKPQVCVDCNDKVGCVDLSDAYLASYAGA